MATTLREPEAPTQAGGSASPQAPVGAPETTPAPVPLDRRCDACGAALVPGQDWCLECGHAAPGRIGGRPGWRAGVTAVGVTLVLVAGAVAAGYAALKHDSNKQAAAIAQAPAGQAPGTAIPVTPGATTPATPGATTTPATPGATTAPATPGATTPATPGVTTPVTPGGGSAFNAPAATPPNLPLPNFPSSTGKTPTPTVQPPTPTPTPVTPTVTPVPSTGNTPTQTPTPTQPSTPTTPSKPAGPQPLTLGADAVNLYDPYGNAIDKGDPADAADGKTSTSWFVTSKNPATIGLGLEVDLDSPTAVRVLRLATATPGFRVEIYGTAETDLPPDILDTRWQHITSRSRIDETAKGGNVAHDGLERIVLGGANHKYRHVMLWFTTPPTAGGPTVKIAELQLLA